MIARLKVPYSSPNNPFPQSLLRTRQTKDKRKTEAVKRRVLSLASLAVPDSSTGVQGDLLALCAVSGTSENSIARLGHATNIAFLKDKKTLKGFRAHIPYRDS